VPDITAERFAAPADFARVQARALIVGLAGLVVATGGFFADRAHFFQSYLIAFLFWMMITLGCFGLLMLHHLTGGAWGLMVRRPLEAASRTFPLLALLFIPVILGLHDLYHWSDIEAVAADPILQLKEPYLNARGFVARAVIYFVLWMVFAWRLSALSLEQDRQEDPALIRAMQRWAAPGFLMLALTMTLASVDWMMSLDPHWYSSLYGLWFFTGSGLSGLTFVILISHYLTERQPMADVFSKDHFHDYGKLLFAFVMLWGYLSFSQFLLIWSGNLPEEIPFYLRRFDGGWMAVSGLLLVGQFVLPFVLLLSADLKKRSAMLVKVAVLVLVMRWVDIVWNTAPTLKAVHGGEHSMLAGLWIDLAALVGLGGIWVWWYMRELGKHPLLPVNDPFLREALGDE